jgi:hypothetical protein
LVTGDRVTTSGDGTRHASIQKGPGRDRVSFLTQRVGGDLQVIPADAAALIRAGRLDPRLFDIAQLLKFNYDDRRADLPLIIQADAGQSRSAARAAMSTVGATHVRDLARLGSLAVHEDHARAGRF